MTIRRITSEDVARHAGVSRTTVSLVLNDVRSIHIRPQTRQKVLDSAMTLGYVPNAMAQALASQRTQAVGLVFTREPHHIATDAFMPQVLDGILDPHNLGALIRSAACAGADGVVIPRDRACGVTAAAEKASAGAAGTLPVAQVTNIAQALEAMKKEGYWVYGLAGEVSHSLYDVKFSGNSVLVIGGEGDGIRPLVRKQCDVVMAIPQYGGVSSLNASVAGGIALFEMARKINA